MRFRFIFDAHERGRKARDSPSSANTDAIGYPAEHDLRIVAQQIGWQTLLRRSTIVLVGMARSRPCVGGFRE